MIERLERIASHLSRFRPVLLQIAALGLGFFAWRMLQGQSFESDIQALFALLSFFWALLLIMIAGLFAQIPAEIPNAAWWTRLSVWVRRLGFKILGYSCKLLVILILLLSYQLLRVMSL